MGYSSAGSGQPLQTLPELPFVVGNLAPDGGVEVSPHVYVPDSATTHWTPTGKKRDIDAEAFCRAYLQNPALTPEKTAFYRGYEAHLRTDVDPEAVEAEVGYCSFYRNAL